MDLDRVSIRTRPAREPIKHQTWDRLLFMHWRIPEAVIRAVAPSDLQIDVYDGTAWIGVTPFTLPAVRPSGLPAPPLVGKSHEKNVRTYVHHQGVPDVWFLSPDARNPLTVLGARLGFSLPYYVARMSLEERDRTIRFASRRVHPGAPKADFEAAWRREEAIPDAQGSFDSQRCANSPWPDRAIGGPGMGAGAGLSLAWTHGTRFTPALDYLPTGSVSKSTSTYVYGRRSHPIA